MTVDVPASSANLGAGFDTLALALELADIFTVEAAPELPPGRVVVSIEGEGAGTLPSDGSDRFSRALQRGLSEIEGVDAASLAWRVRMHNAIPIGRGLGSSAAATVGGLAAADLLLGGGRLSADRMLELAIESEGHADNVAAALHGGFTVVARLGDEAATGSVALARFEPPAGLLAVLFVPDRALSTQRMREVLPEAVPRLDAVHNVARASLAVAAIASGRLELLGAAMDDRLHEPYRASVFPDLPRLIAAARAAGALGACLSGSGSTILAFADGRDLAADVAEALQRAAAATRLGGRAMVLRPRSQGVIAVGPPSAV
ncbi:homoserine kinase [soil metagenome]